MSLLKLIGTEVNNKIDLVYKDKAGKVEIKPLTISDLSVLLEKYTDEMAMLLNGTGDIFKGIANSAPNFIVSFIELGLVEKVEGNFIKNLPFSIQLKLCDEIWKLSVIDTDYLGKLVGRLVNGLGAAAQKVQEEPQKQEELKKALEENRKALEKSGK